MASVSMISNLAFDQWYPRGLAVKLIPRYRPRLSVTHTFRCEMYAVTARCGDSLILINATVTQVS